MAEEDSFDIDLYGDDAEEPADTAQDIQHEENMENTEATEPDNSKSLKPAPASNENIATKTETKQPEEEVIMEESANNNLPNSEKPALESASVGNRETNPNADFALVISDLQWWESDDDIRGWANLAGQEDHLKDITFSEFKVNGKSKGQAYIEFDTVVAASLTKAQIEAADQERHTSMRHTVAFHSLDANPFKTLPKDGPARQDTRVAPRGGPANGQSFGQGNFRGAPRGNRGGSGFRGGGQFNGPQGNNMPNGFSMSGFSGPAAMNGFNNFRGGMNNMRGGVRGGMARGNMGMMNAMPNMGGMSGMPNYNMMGGMGMNMAMAMGGMTGFGNANTAHFNPNFFQNQQGQQITGGEGWNPHGAKRPRPE